jgi:hypothetical protein
MSSPSPDINPFDALQAAALELTAGVTEPSVYERATKALLRCLDPSSGENGSGYAAWTAASKRALLKTLLLQACSQRPNILLHIACSNASAGSKWVMPALARELTPLLKELLAEPSPPLDAVLAAITLRESLSEAFDQEELSALHIRTFQRFEREDLALPYSCAFNDDIYHRNREDLEHAPALTEDARLGLRHLITIDWVIGQGPAPLADDRRLVNTLRAKIPAGSSSEAERDDLAAARALLARYVAREEQIEELKASGAWDKLGASDAYRAALTTLIANRSRIARSLRGRPSALRKRLATLKPYQAVHAAANIALGRSGVSLPLVPKPKVAVCISGQLRGFTRAFATWQKSLLVGLDYDIYVHSWELIGHSGAEPYRHSLPFEGRALGAAYRDQCQNLTYEAVKERYPSLFGELAKSGKTTVAELQSFYGTEHVVLENDRDERFSGWSNSAKMHYKIKASSDLAFASGKAYDLIVRIRPDMPITYLGFGWHDVLRRCKSEPVLFAENPIGAHYGLVVQGDQLAIGRPEVLRTYADTYATFPELVAPHGLYKASTEFTGHVSLAYVSWLHGIRVERAPLKREGLADPKALSSATILAAVQRDAEGRNDSWDQRLIAAIQSDIE